MLLNIIEALRQWAQEETSIESVILVGSWRGEQTVPIPTWICAS